MAEIGKGGVWHRKTQWKYHVWKELCRQFGRKLEAMKFSLRNKLSQNLIISPCIVHQPTEPKPKMDELQAVLG